MNRCHRYDEREKLLAQIRALGFALVELNLFLDSHPTNRNALRYFRRYKDELARLTATYEKDYGPLTAAGGDSSSDTWEWIERPWPWESAEDIKED